MKKDLQSFTVCDGNGKVKISPVDILSVLKERRFPSIKTTEAVQTQGGLTHHCRLHPFYGMSYYGSVPVFDIIDRFPSATILKRLNWIGVSSSTSSTLVISWGSTVPVLSILIAALVIVDGRYDPPHLYFTRRACDFHRVRLLAVYGNVSIRYKILWLGLNMVRVQWFLTFHCSFRECLLLPPWSLNLCVVLHSTNEQGNFRLKVVVLYA